ncbi:putative 28S rRNA (cytosine-C(5))-methyltransferase [Homalodisca vitripennis]|nr:putative 28S rRNA (cytosine-C(5))-methyltransferase [Homalodisca vitripennis]
MYHKLSLYKCAGELLKLAKENGINVKHVLYNNKKYQFWNIKALYALVLQALKHWDVLEILINESKILVNEPKFNEWHVRILITELIFGKKEIDSDNTFVQTILKYEDKFKEVVASKPVQKILLKYNEPISDIKGKHLQFINLIEFCCRLYKPSRDFKHGVKAVL